MLNGARRERFSTKEYAPDRMVSVHDPHMRHGRKSATRRFDGHKDGIAVDPESHLIVTAEVLPGNAQDHEWLCSRLVSCVASTASLYLNTGCNWGEERSRKGLDLDPGSRCDHLWHERA